MLIDEGSFVQYDAEMISRDVLNFPPYEEKFLKAKEATLLNEAVIYGNVKISGSTVVIFVMDGNFMMGTMRCVISEKIELAFVRLGLREKLARGGCDGVWRHLAKVVREHFLEEPRERV